MAAPGQVMALHFGCLARNGRGSINIIATFWRRFRRSHFKTNTGIKGVLLSTLELCEQEL